jgi:hypothetical protein
VTIIEFHVAMVNARPQDPLESKKVRSGFSIFSVGRFAVCAFVSCSSVVLDPENAVSSRNLVGFSSKDR